MTDDADDYFPFEGSPEAHARLAERVSSPEFRAWYRQKTRDYIVERMRGHLKVMEGYPDVPHTARSMAGLKQTLELAIIAFAHEQAADKVEG